MTYLTSVANGIADAGSATLNSSSLTVSGSNKVMWAIVGNSDGTPATPTGVVWDSAGFNEALTIQGSGITFGTFGNASLWRLIAPSNATGVVTVTWAASKGERIIGVWVETDIDQTTPNGTVSSGSVSTETTPVSSAALTTTVGQRVLQLAHALDTTEFTGGPPFTTPSGTERHDVVTSGIPYDAVAMQEETASGTSTTPQWASVDSVEDGWATFSFALNVAGAGATSEQEGARFGNDDAAEAAHTWAAAQDTNITAPAGQTQVVNLIVNATGTLGAKTFKLQYRKVGDSTWRDMPVQ